MSSLNRNLRSLLEKTVLKARELAEKGALEALTTLGVDQPKPFDHLTSEQRRLRNQLRARGRQLGDTLDKDSGRQELRHLIEVVAYEHWHRMLFARFLAENGLLLEPEHQVPVSLDDVEELARDAGVDVWELAGRYAQRMLPAVFRADDPVLALPLARETRVALEKLVGELPREVFLADDSLGWTYQFWQAQRKEEVNKSGVKIGADELSPVTQLFTEDYMVEFLLHNTLGAWWAGKLGPLAAASEEEARAQAGLPERGGLRIEWTYLRFVQDEQTQRWTPAAGTFAGWPRQAKDVTVLDPSMGSGHFLVFALPLLARLRMEEENLGAAAAVAAVLRDNLYGLELDERCTQIAAFNLALAAWRLGGYQPLPPLHLACCGLQLRGTEEEWLAIARQTVRRSGLSAADRLFADPESLDHRLEDRVVTGMRELHRLFRHAPVLGSLIDPRNAVGGLGEQGRASAGEMGLFMRWDELAPLLQEALAEESSGDADTHELAVTARGLTKAAEILAGQFTLVITNVPYLGRGKQDDALKDYCARVYPEAKADLATAFVERCLAFCTPSVGATALVTPQNWLFLRSYKHLRKTLLTKVTWNFVARLGEHGFDSAAAAGAFTALLSLTRNTASASHQLAGWDAAAPDTPEGKADVLRSGASVCVSQSGQLGNPDAAVIFDEPTTLPLLATLADSFQGIKTGDDERYRIFFWEVPRLCETWRPYQSTVDATAHYGGRFFLLRWENNGDGLARRQGLGAWARRGVMVSQMRELPAALCCGDAFDSNAGPIVPRDPAHLPAIWAFCSSPDYSRAVRAIDQALKVTNANLVKVPFDLEHWQKVAAEKYPNGLPKPYSSDPTQWLFNGHPRGSDQPLHVAVARLLGYQWPRQTGSSFPDCPALEPDGLEAHADAGGIVCLSPVHGERAGADRLRALLSAALGDCDEHALIAATGSKVRDLETWLRDEFFEQHCALFHHRPFVWHLWDGRKDGFHALVNYHQLAAPNGAGRKLLETLTYTYLGDWIRKQQDAMKRNEPGAEDRLIAAQSLQKELEAILAGEPPYDLFIRWKPLHQQPIGWEPDLNDGVRLNIRPFMLANDVGRKGAGLLRSKPNIKWEKDRGKEPQRPKDDYPWFWGWDEKTQDFPGGADFDGNRWNACHYTPAAKRAARNSVAET